MLQHIFKLYDDTNNMIYDYKSLKTNAGDNRRNDVKQNDVFYVKLNDNYKIIKIELILSLIDGVNNTTVDCKIYKTYNSNFLSIKYHRKINLISVNNNLGDLENTILSNSSKIDINKDDISTNLIKVNSNVGDISSNLGKINTNKNDISSNSGQINTNKSDISSNLGKINNIKKTIMLKNIYFTDFDSKDESFSKELLSLNNIAGSPRTANIHTVSMEYYFKKGDVIEIDCKLMFQHSTYNYSHHTLLYYDLYDGGIVDSNKALLITETRRYNQFSLINEKDRVIAYNKLCYKVKYDMNTIRFNIMIGVAHPKMTVVYLHYIVKNGLNHVSIKHYGKS